MRNIAGRANHLFDAYIAVDWSARNTPSPAKPTADALWVGQFDVRSGARQETYWRTRHQCIDYLRESLCAFVRDRKRVLIGYDLNLGFPVGFADALRLDDDGPPWRRTWRYLAALLRDSEENTNNRFEVAALLNEQCQPRDASGGGPFWGCPATEVRPSLHPTSPSYPFVTSSGHALKRLRWTEQREPRAQPVWKLAGRASVGGQTLVGIPYVAGLHDDARLTAHSIVWPFESGFHPVSVAPGSAPLVVHVEIWPGMLGKRLDASLIRDRAQVRATVEWLAECDDSGELAGCLSAPDSLGPQAQVDCLREEGWILGSGYSKVTTAPSVQAQRNSPEET